MAVALIVAAGRGERLGSDRPKALVTLSGRPMLEWSVLALRAVPSISAIVVALPADCLDAAPAGCIAVAGGAVRSESVALTLAAAPLGDPVIVHDAARPLASGALFARCVAYLAQRPDVDGVLAAAPVADTLKRVAGDGAAILGTVDRASLWAVQTPQVFRRAVLEEVLAAASDELLAQATDEAWLLERAGHTVHVLDAGEPNFKVTTPTDLRLAELLLAGRDA
jgi:2-C-methyl-D-erythritol 4-phosphate cytidylyltransferase